MSRYADLKEATLEADLTDYLTSHNVYNVLEILEKIVSKMPDQYDIEAAKLRAKKKLDNAATCDRLAKSTRQEVEVLKRLKGEWINMKEGVVL
jgi:hypothetical protein